LVVDDDPIVREIYRLALERRGYGVMVAADGIEALEMLTTADPNFMFLDIRMPRMGGLELLTRISGDPATPHIPVVMLSNYGEPDLVAKTLSLSAKEYLIKVATDPLQLAAVVARWLGQPPSGPGEVER
jgi:CheY-like chemotaxis protein